MSNKFQETRDRCYTYFRDNEIDHRNEVFDILMSIDTARALNCQWIFDQYKEGHFLLEDADEVRDVIQQFYRNRNKLPRDRRELASYSYPEVLSIISSFPMPMDRRRSTCKTLSDSLSIDPNIFDVLMTADPEGGKNCQWIFDQYSNKQFLLEDVGRVKDDIDLFLKNRRSLPVSERPLNRYTYSQLKQLITRWDLTDYDFTPVIEDNSDILVLSHTGYGKLSTPRTEAASCLLGSGTKWCTAAKVSDNQFEYYNSRGPLYVWEDYKIGKKFQFHFEEGQFMDPLDNNISLELMQYFRNEHPVLSRFFKEKEETVDFVPEGVISYAENVIGGRWYEKEYIILTSPINTLNYARHVVKEKWPEAEPVFLEYPGYGIIYARDALKHRWPELEQVIMRSRLSVGYARDVIGGRWPEVEKYIRRVPLPAAIYARDVLKHRWPKAESVIARDPEASYFYARDVIKGRWLKGELTILLDEVWGKHYRKDVMGM